MPGFTKTQIIALVGFVIVLISIPVSFSLVREQQIFSSRASEQKKVATSSASTTATKPRPIPTNSPLTDLQKLIQGNDTTSETPNSNTSPATTNATTSETSTNLAFGPTLSFQVSLEGRPANKQTDKVFIGIAQGQAITSPTYILTFTVDVPDSGKFSGLSLAGLNPGSIYTAYIKGSSQIDSGITFTMNPNESSLNNGKPVILISGDLNEDNVINSADYTIARSYYGTTPTSKNWNPRVDLNKDNIINNWDLLYINNNMGKVGTSGTWISTPKTTTSLINQNPISPVGGPANFGDLLLSSSPSAEINPTATPSSGYWLYVP